MRETLAHRASEVPYNHREVLRAEELLATMLQLSGASSLTVQAVFEDANRKKLIDLDHLDVEDAASSVATKETVTFVLDCLLIVLASPIRALRVARPLMISPSSEHGPAFTPGARLTRQSALATIAS